jgi:protein Tex
MIEEKFIRIIAQEAGVSPEQVAAVIPFFDKGAAVPFVAHYRRDVTGNLKEKPLEIIEERNNYFTALTNRRNAVLENIEKQGALTPERRARIENTTSQAVLEDLYLPFKKRQRSKADIAIDQGLLPLADYIWNQEGGKSLLEFAAGFIDTQKGISSPEEALIGAQNILAERIFMDADARGHVRETMLKKGCIRTRSTRNADDKMKRFKEFYDFSKTLQKVAPGQVLTILRGVRNGVLRMDIETDDTAMVDELVKQFLKQDPSPFEPAIRLIVDDACKRLLRPAIENEVIGIVRRHADQEVIRGFRENIEHVLMTPPAGAVSVIGVYAAEGGQCSLAVLSSSGMLRDTAVINIPEADSEEEAGKPLVSLLDRHNVNAIAIGNTGSSRQAGGFIRGLLRKNKRKNVYAVYVNETGSVQWGASKAAQEEFQDLDTGLRTAISIARLFRDPLAEFVKFEPRGLGIGQNLHDVNQRRLRDGLNRGIENVVNRIGADVNTASPEFLRYICGIQMGAAQNIAAFRNENGNIKSRTQLMDVSGIGEKTFEQCAGFLRIPDAENPLDRTAIHPAWYDAVEKMAEKAGATIGDLIGNAELAAKLDPEAAGNEEIGRHTIEFIRRELAGTRRDPRESFRPPRFLPDVHSLDELQEGMETEGMVTNVTDFGAFVDIGLQQDGLIHLSELANRFVDDPRNILRPGDIVQVRIIKVEREEKRISLSRKVMLRAPRKAGPAKYDRNRAPGGGRDRPGKTAGKDEAQARRKPRRKDSDTRRDRPRKPDRPQKSSGSTDKLDNTMLADQLAALRDKFNS